MAHAAAKEGAKAAAKAAAAAPAAAKTRKDFVASFAEAVTRFAAKDSGEHVLALIPEIAANELEAGRSELWLWDASSASVYLTHACGVQAERKRHYAASGQGAIGRGAQARQPAENVALVPLSTDDRELAERTGLGHVSTYPLAAKEQFLGVLAIYTAEPADSELLRWWQLYVELASVAAHEVLSEVESKKTITQLSLLFEATRLLNSTLDLSELLELILKIARTETAAERGSVFLVDQKAQQLWSIVASGLDRQEIRVPFGRGVAGKVAQSGEIINTGDAYALEYFDPSYDKKFGYTTRSLLCMPIRHHDGQVVGVIQLLNKKGAEKFTPGDEEFLTKLSGHMAMALENARLHREIVEKQRLEKEMALARQIQRSLLPEAPPIVPGYDLAVLNEPCFEVGGDYYDFLNLGPQTLLLVIADVEGKGVSSALVMSNLQATLRALVMHLHSLEVLALSLNEMICTDTKSEKFLSMFLGLIDTRRRGLHYINAGHVPPILVSGETGEARPLEEGGTVIGLFPRAEYNRGSARLTPGDVLVCCTDGILEAMNAAEDEYGSERLSACVARHRTKSAQAIVDAVLADVNSFAREGTHLDDKVLMVMKVTPTGGMETARGAPAN